MADFPFRTYICAYVLSRINYALSAADRCRLTPTRGGRGPARLVGYVHLVGAFEVGWICTNGISRTSHHKPFNGLTANLYLALRLRMQVHRSSNPPGERPAVGRPKREASHAALRLFFNKTVTVMGHGIPTSPCSRCSAPRSWPCHGEAGN